MTLIEQLNWRYAAKRLNGQKIPDQKLTNILEAIRLAPSSAGLQPYTVIVVEDKETLKKIHAEAAQQAQIPDASHLLVFAAYAQTTGENVQETFQLTAQTRNMPFENLKEYADRISGYITSRSNEENFNWAARQAYLALGHAVVAAAVEEVDATPMEGFIPDKMDEILGLKEKGLRSVVILAMGYRDASNDFLSGAKKVRRPAEQLFIHV